ncbi:recombinase RecA [Clostridium perfringens]|uniref:recombinase RecA n=1 Tax=Clostridium perfringens TaxID=1502 RepID=UPI003D32C8A6
MVDIKAEKLKAIEMAMGAIEKQYGKGSVMMLGANTRANIDCISTSSLKLNRALGIGGLPKGRITEIYGPESSGKTTVAIHVCAEAQKLGGVCAYIDAEHAFDVNYAKNLGVDVDELIFSQPDCGEQALEIAEKLISSGAIDVLVVDSVASLVPRAEIEGEMGASHVGIQARLMSQALRKLTGLINKSDCVVIFINQLREKVGIMFGNPETTPGGRALKFYASVRIDIRRIGTIKGKDGEMVANETKIKIVKNKVAPPFKEDKFEIEFGKGIDSIGELIDLGVEYQIISKSGSWFAYGDIRLGQGKPKVKEFLLDNLDIKVEIEELIYEAMNIPYKE